MGIATFLIGMPADVRSMIGWSAAAPAARPAPRAGLRARRRVVGRGARGDRERPGGQARLVRHVPAARRAARLHHRQRPVPGDQLRCSRTPTAPAQRSQAFLDWGWRVPFLFSAVMVIIGLWVRLRLVESDGVRRRPRSRASITQAAARHACFRSHWQPAHPRHVHHAGHVRALLPDDELHAVVRHQAGRSRAASHAQAPPRRTDHLRRDGFAAQFYPGSASATPTSCSCRSSACVFFGIFTLVSGPLADRDRPTATAASGSPVGDHRVRPQLRAVPAAPGDRSSPGRSCQAFLVDRLRAHGRHASARWARVLPELFPTNVRYTGSAIAYNVSSILGAAVAPFIGGVRSGQLGDGSPWLGRRLPVGDGGADLHRAPARAGDEGHRLRRQPRSRRDRIAIARLSRGTARAAAWS